MFSASTSFALYRHKSQNLGSAGFAPSTNGGYFLYVTAAHEFGGSLDRDTSRTIPLRFVRLAHSSNFPFASSSRARVELLSTAAPRAHCVDSLSTTSGEHRGTPQGTGSDLRTDPMEISTKHSSEPPVRSREVEGPRVGGIDEAKRASGGERRVQQQRLI